MDKEDIYIYIYIHTHTHTHIYIYMYICMYTHTHRMEYCSATKKNEILPFSTTWDIMLREISQTEKAKYYMLSLICGI